MNRDHRPRSITDTTVTAVLAVGATARVTRLITRDDFPFRHLRDWSLTRFGEHGWLSRLLECPWCTGVWVAAPATVSAALFGHTRWWRLLAAWMGLSMAASAAVVLTAGGPDVVIQQVDDNSGDNTGDNDNPSDNPSDNAATDQGGTGSVPGTR